MGNGGGSGGQCGRGRGNGSIVSEGGGKGCLLYGMKMMMRMILLLSLLSLTSQ